MNDAIADALAGEIVLHSNALAVVTRNCVVVREGMRGARIVMSVESITGVRKVTTTNPGLLVISCGLCTIAAAAYASKQPWEVSVTIALIGSLFIMGYIGTRRAAVLFVLENENIESLKGTFREATSTIRAVERVRRKDLSLDVTREGTV